MSFLSQLFFRTAGNHRSIPEMLEDGAVILDVRTRSEFASGHLTRAINIPLDQLHSQIQRLDKSKPIITCCASGMRSGTAKGILKSHGFQEVVNGGGWARLKRFDA